MSTSVYENTCVNDCSDSNSHLKYGSDSRPSNFFSSYLNYQALQSETSRLDKPRLCWGPLEWTTFPKCQKFHQNPPWLCRKSMAALSLKTERGILQLACFQGSQRLSEMPWEVLFAGNCRQVAQWEEVLRSAGWKEARGIWYCQRRWTCRHFGYLEWFGILTSNSARFWFN